MAFRYGGEGFIVPLANTDEQAVTALLRKSTTAYAEPSLRFGVSDIGRGWSL